MDKRTINQRLTKAYNQGVDLAQRNPPNQAEEDAWLSDDGGTDHRLSTLQRHAYKQHAAGIRAGLRGEGPAPEVP